jgi:hypothetical protein
MIGSGSVNFSFRKYLLVSGIFCMLVPLQWFVLAAFPLVKLRWCFFEPGALITICTLLSIFLILPTRMLPIAEAADISGTLLMALQLLMWLIWFCLAIWKSVRWLFRRHQAQTAAHP